MPRSWRPRSVILSGAAPKILVTGWHQEEEPGGIALVTGNVANHSNVTQREVVVTALAQKGGHTVAAGRGVVPELPAGETAKFQIFLVGSSTSGAQVTVAVTPSTLG